MSELELLKEQVAELRWQVDRLTTRLNVALELLGECKLTGYPESAGRVAERIEQAERRDYVAADADDVTGKVRAVAPAASSAPSSADGPSVRPPDAAASLPPAGENPFVPVVPSEAPLHQQTHRYDHATERDRKLGQALDILDSLGRRK